MDPTDRAEQLLALPTLEVDTEAALARLRGRTATAAGARGIRPPGRAATAARWLGATAALVAVTLTLALTGVADSIFQIFEARQLAPVTVTATDLRALDELARFGRLSWSAPPAAHRVATLAAAAAESGLAPIAVQVPATIGTDPRYSVVPRATATFVFDAATARASAAALGRTAPPMPAGLDGSTLVISGGPAIVVSYGDASGGPSLVVAAGRAPTVGSDGASVATIQSYLLAQPGVSPELAAQLRAIGDPASTLPVPIPAGQAAAKAVRVHGASGLFIGDATGIGSGVLWQQNGLIYAVGGTLPEAEIIAVADSLR